MGKSKKKPTPVHMKQEEEPMIIDMHELMHKRSGVPRLFFKTGGYKTSKDKPRDKSYKRNEWD